MFPLETYFQPLLENFFRSLGTKHRQNPSPALPLSGEGD
jgi:hypothetical protein